MTAAVPELKDQVRAFWQQAACGEELYLHDGAEDVYATQAAERYRLEPYIIGFAEFDRWAGRRVLEIGVGLGADHERFARAGAVLSGIDLTERAIVHTRARLARTGLASELRVADAEALPFPDATFDLVYSWGVIHHSPDTGRAAREILRVLKPGGTFKVMIYHKHALVAYMLWLRYALLRGRPWTGLHEIIACRLESPGTKAYTPDDAGRLFEGADDLVVRTVLTHGDLLESAAGQRHRGPLLALARAIWPRWAIRALLPGHGLFMLVQGTKRRSLNEPLAPARSGT